MRQDEEHLHILSILYYVYAGIIAVLSLVGLCYVFVGFTFLDTPPAPAGRPPSAPPPQVGWFFVLFGGAFTLFGWAVAVLVALAGCFLVRHIHWLYCLCVAGLICIHIPLGTLLGVFTIIVLVRPSVKELFTTAPASPANLPEEMPYYGTEDPSFRPGPGP